MDYSTAEATLDESQIKYSPKTVNDAELLGLTARSSHPPPPPTKPVISSKPQPIQTSPTQGPTGTGAQSGTVTSPPAPVSVEFFPYRPVATGSTAPVIQPGRVQQLTDSLRLSSPATAPMGTNSNATQSGAWLCLSCSNHNTTPACLTCRAPKPQSTPARSSVAALGQQIGGAIRLVAPQDGMMKPVLTTQPKAQVSQPAVGDQSVDENRLQRQRLAARQHSRTYSLCNRLMRYVCVFVQDFDMYSTYMMKMCP